jgi:hypothetical protein
VTARARNILIILLAFGFGVATATLLSGDPLNASFVAILLGFALLALFVWNRNA